MRELVGLKIEVDTREATAALRENERAWERADAAAQKAGKAFDDTARRQAKLAESVAAAVKDASARIDPLVKKIEADNKRVDAEQAKLARNVQQGAGQMDSALAALGRRIVAVFAVERLMAFGASVVRNAGHIQDLSDKTGLSTSAIQRFDYAVRLTGGTVDQVATAIGAMSKNLSGPGGAADALGKLGLQQAALLRMRPEDAFLAIAEAVRQIKNPMEQATVVQKVFGEAGMQILPAMKAGFKAAGDEAERLGLVIGEENVQALDKFGDALDRIMLRAKAVIANLLGGFAGEVAGVFNLLARVPAESFRTMVRELGAAISQAGTALHGGATDGTRATWGALLRNTGGPFAALLGDLVTMGNPAATGLQGLGRRLTASVGGDASSDWRSIIDAVRADGTGAQVGRADTQIHDQAAASTSRLTAARETLKKKTDELTASTLAYLRAQGVTIGLGGGASMADRTAAYRGLLSGAGGLYLQTGIAGAMRPDVAGALNIGAHPYSTIGLQQAVTGTPGLSSGISSGTAPGGGFWAGRYGNAVGAGIGIAGSAAVGAMTGGDPYASMVGSGAAAVSGAMMAGAGLSVAALGAATMGIGAAAVGVYMLVKHFASVSKEVKQARQEVDTFQQSLWQTMTAQQVNEAAGEKWAATTIVVRDAFVRMGRTAGEAEMLVGQLLNTDRPDAAREAMARINDVMSDYQAILAGTNEHMGELLTQAGTLGQRLPDALLKALDAASKFGDMTEENVRLIKQLTQAPEVDWKAYEEAAGRYGIDPAALGQGYQQNKTTTTAQQMIDDVEILQRGGATMGTILAGMREEISALVQQSVKFGTELPENMKPWIDELFRTGQLVDENGQALTDLANLKFGESLQTTFQRVAESIQELVDLLKGPLTGALDTIGGKVVRPRVEVEFDPAGGQTLPEGRGDGEYMAQGGVVYAAKGWPRPRGTDTIPAMLTPGEGVLSRRGMAALGALNAGVGGGGGIDYQRIGAEVARALRAEPPRISVDGRDLSGSLLRPMARTAQLYTGTV